MSIIWIKGTLFKFRQQLLYSNLAIILTIMLFISSIIFGEILFMDSVAYVCLILTLVFSFIYGMSMYLTDGFKEVPKEHKTESITLDEIINSINVVENNMEEVSKITTIEPIKEVSKPVYESMKYKNRLKNIIVKINIEKLINLDKKLFTEDKY